MSNIEITLPDGSKQSVAAETRPIDIARGISPRLADAAIAAKVNGEMVNSATHLAEWDLRREAKRRPLGRRGGAAAHQGESKQGKGSETMHGSARLERMVIESLARRALRLVCCEHERAGDQRLAQ